METPLPTPPPTPPRPEGSPSGFLVSAFYKFVALNDYEDLRPQIFQFAKNQGVLGTLLLAEEGINGTLSGEPENLRAVIDYLRSDPRLSDLETKESWALDPPFFRLRVKLKREIVTMGCPNVDPTKTVGTYVSPEDWNELVDDPEVLLIDTRNDYEVAIGSFEGAVDPKTDNFREFPAWMRQFAPLEKKPPVAMYCTGGIRCEKATSLLRAEGFEEVFHLQGGILKYLEVIPPEESRWQGECFVFDQRVSVKSGLDVGSYDMCHACRWPLTKDDKQSDLFVEGVSCPRCEGQWTEKQLKSFSNRQQQMEIAEKTNRQHLGQFIANSAGPVGESRS